MRPLLVAAGGTIASRRTDAGVQRVLSGADLLAGVGLAGEVDVIDASRGASWAFGIDDVVHIARTAVDAAASGDHAGVVVTHGTDTIEDTAFVAWLLGGAAASERCPIVFTGAMRHDGHPEADGPVNLWDAVALARSGTAVAGPVVYLAGTAHHARWATKTDTASLDSFRSVGAGAPEPPSPPPAVPAGAPVEAAVAQVQSHPGVDGNVIDRHLDAGIRGLVVEGTGAGNVQPTLAAGIERALAAGVPVVVTSRCWTGPVSPTYGGRGGGFELAAIGCVGAGDLPTHKARWALSVALGADPSLDAVRAWFGRLVGG